MFVCLLYPDASVVVVAAAAIVATLTRNAQVGRPTDRQAACSSGDLFSQLLVLVVPANIIAGIFISLSDHTDTTFFTILSCRCSFWRSLFLAYFCSSFFRSPSIIAAIRLFTQRY